MSFEKPKKHLEKLLSGKQPCHCSLQALSTLPRASLRSILLLKLMKAWLMNVRVQDKCLKIKKIIWKQDELVANPMMLLFLDTPRINLEAE